MSGIFDFIRKQPGNATPNQSPVVGQNDQIVAPPQANSSLTPQEIPAEQPSTIDTNITQQSVPEVTPENNSVDVAPVVTPELPVVETPADTSSADMAIQAPAKENFQPAPKDVVGSESPDQNAPKKEIQNNQQNSGGQKNQSQNQVNLKNDPPYQPKNNSNQNNNQNNQSQKNQPAPKPETSSLQSNLNTQKRGDLDVMTHLTQRSNRVLVSANAKARELQNANVDSEHLLYGLLADGEIYKLFIDLKVQPQMVEQELVKIYKKESSTKPPQLSPRIKLIIDNSLVIARKLGYEFIAPEHLLIALFEEGEGVGARVLVKLGLKKEDLNKKITGKKEGVEMDANGKPVEKKKSALEQYTIDLTAKAALGQLDPVVERADVIERVIHILSRRMKNNPALIGEPGVGKTAVVEGLAQRIVDKQVPESLMDKKIVILDLTNVIAGASHRGDFEERMKNIIEELKASKGKIIVFIDEMHTIVGAGASGDGALDASNFLKPALSRAEIQLIGATTITEYRRYVEKDPALERRMQTVLVPEPTEEAAIKMLKAARDKFEAFHKVKIPDDTVEAAVKLSKRYIGDRFLPDKAFDLMDEAAAAVRLPMLSLPEEIKSIETRVAQLNQELQENEKKGEKVKARILRSKIDEVQANLNQKKDEYNIKKAQTTTAVSVEIIKDIIAKRTGVPVSKITSTETERLTTLEDIMHKRLIAQERAVASVSQAVRRGRAGLKSNQRPVGSFVFLGPSGVGKTELAKTLAEILFGQEESMIRFDMTEYMEKHEVAKLLGPPPGYVGYEEGGKLTESVRRMPYSVVLFDEVEKAHPDIFNILLQILDDGRLTDNKGRTISFKNTVVICTSNIGTKMIQEEMLKNGKTDVEEPPVLSTYTFSPRGREILTIGNKYFERDTSIGTGTSWKNGILQGYFAGQELQSDVQIFPIPAAPIEGQDPNAEVPSQPAPEKLDFPIIGYDSHAISPEGIEMISRDNLLFFRPMTTDKTWKVTTLIEYFKDNMVVNALPDTPDEQLPTVKLRTHAFSPAKQEVVTYKDRYWTRDESSKEWKTGELKDYFMGQTVDQGALPISHWDIHVFSPAGREMILVGNDIYYREANATAWKQQTLSAYFGTDFPLEKELAERKEMEDSSDKKKYDVIKGKVMDELLKFFRPELVNRFDEVIVFEPLKFEDMIKIVKLQLKSLTKLLEEQELGFTCTDGAIKQIVREGFDPIYGARPLRRAIQRVIENPISEMIIGQKVLPGNTIVVDHNGEEFTFDVNVERTVSTDSSSTTQKSGPIKEYTCNVCSTQFKTEVLENSTVICSSCASKNVKEGSVTNETGMVMDKLKQKIDEEPIAPQSPMAVMPESSEQSQNSAAT